MRFQAGDLIHNKVSNEDGRVTEVTTETGEVLYVFAVPLDSTSWSLGARETRWPESEGEPSTNDFLRRE